MTYLMLLTTFTLYLAIFPNSAVTCPDGTIHEECGKCQCTNDPHINTFDNVYYDQHMSLCYQYVTQCPGDLTAYIPFEICGCHYPCSRGSNIKCIGDIAIKFFNESGAETFDISIDHTSAATAITPGTHIFDTTNNHAFAYSFTSLIHYFNIYSGAAAANSFYAYISYRSGNLQIFLSESYFQSKVCGLCGLFDGDQSNEFLGSDNVQYMPAGYPIPWIPTSATFIHNFSLTYPCGDQTDPCPDCCEIGDCAADIICDCPSVPDPCLTCCPNDSCSNLQLDCDCGRPDASADCSGCPDCDCAQCDCFGAMAEPVMLDRNALSHHDTVVIPDITTACSNAATPCCDQLWEDVISAEGWVNRLEDQTEAKDNWMELNCIRDVCLLTENAFGSSGSSGSCGDLAAFPFNFANEIAIQIATDTFPVTLVQMAIDTTVAATTTAAATTTVAAATTTVAATTTINKKSDSSSSDRKESSDSDSTEVFSDHESSVLYDNYGTKQTYTINISFGKHSWIVVMISGLIISIALLCMCNKFGCNKKRNYVVEVDELSIQYQ